MWNSMMLIGDWILLVLAACLAVPFLVLTIEALASLLPPRRPQAGQRLRCAVLVPAHDEESSIALTARNLREQLAPGERLLVVADNCTDGTANAARHAGAEVVERFDASQRGKGFALDHGLKHLAADPPDVVVIVDADCELHSGALDSLVRQVASTGRPAQGIYLIGTGREPDPRRRLSAFAVVLKNEIRPRGLDRLGMPCLLTGTGMAFPWRAIQSANLATGNIVEDMKLGIDLAMAGHAPLLCARAKLSGAAAPDRRSAAQQRTRWEHGHVQTMVNQVPRLLAGSITRARPRLLGLALEMSVPPVSLLLIAWVILFSVCLISWQWAEGHWAPVVVLSGAAFAAGGAVFLAWAKFGRRTLPMLTLFAAPLYIAWKLPVYGKLLVARERQWVRTDRVQLQSGRPA
jgi:cellulose synthase/poly-beta-1,6-N-acetylglucosamine synthase-like glycosyltransferase